MKKWGLILFFIMLIFAFGVIGDECESGIDENHDGHVTCAKCDDSTLVKFGTDQDTGNDILRTCQQVNPGGFLGYDFEHNRISKLEVIFNWSDVPEISKGMFFANQFNFEIGQGGYFGPQIDVYSNMAIRKVIFSMWSTDNTPGAGWTCHPYPNTTSWCVGGTGEGNTCQCMLRSDLSGDRYYNWEEGKEYKLTLQKEVELTDGVVWNATITDISSGTAKLIGKMKLDDQTMSNGTKLKGYGLITGVGGFEEYYYGNENFCLTTEHMKLIRKGPYADDKWLARKATQQDPICFKSNRSSFQPGIVVEDLGKSANREVPFPPYPASWSWQDKILWNFPKDINVSTLCGNNQIDFVEKCDKDNLNTKTCQDFSFNSGTLSCYANCSGFNISNCYNLNSQNLSLNSGINFISFSQNLTNNNISNLIYGNENKITAIFSYDNGWNVYYPSKVEISNLTKIDAGKGYIIVANESVNLSYSGIPTTFSFNFNKGWNLFGVGNMNNVSNILAGIDYSVVYNFNGTDYTKMDNSTNLFPGKAYWVYVR